MDNIFANHDLEAAARRMLAKITSSQDILKPLYLQPDRALYLAENSGIIFKVYRDGWLLEREYVVAQKAGVIGIPIPEMLTFEVDTPAVLAMRYVTGKPLSSSFPSAARKAGQYLQQFHMIGATPPFSGGQQQWDEFILWWSRKEIEKVRRLRVLDSFYIQKLHACFDALQPVLAQRPIVLLHGDLQAAHILVDPCTELVLAFLDFADAQPGDPLLDIAVASLWDHKLADLLLEGYRNIVNTDDTKQLLALYRLLRHVAEVPWLLERGFQVLAARNVEAIQAELKG